MNEPAILQIAQRLPAQFIDGAFSDNAWYVSVAGTRQSLCWDRIRLADKKLLLAPEHGRLLHACKLFMSLAGQVQIGRLHRPVKGSSLVALFGSLRRFLQWMTSRGIYDFSALTLEDVLGYRKFVESAMTVVTRKTGILPPGARKTLSPNAQFGRSYAVICLARLAAGMGTYGCRLNAREVDDIFASISSKVTTEKPTELIPDELFRRIVLSALALLREPGVTAVIDTIQAFQTDWDERRHTRGVGDKKFGWRRTSYYEKWRKRNGRSVIIIQGNEYNPTALRLKDIAKLVEIIRGACLTVVAALVGMRLSELRTLRRNCLRTTSLDDGRVLLSLHGTLFKTVDNSAGEETDWVAGWDGAEQPVRLAIEILDRLASAEGSEVLLPRARPAMGNNIDPCLSPVKIADFVRSFARYVNVGEDWPFTMHQFRKTFARFVVLSSINASLALMRHFKHVSLQMTERYFPSDPDLIGEIIEASETLIAGRLETIFGAERLGGLKGRDIVAQNAAYRGSEHAKELKDLVAMTMRDPTVRVLMHVYGVCLYDEATAKCKGDFSNIGMWTCADCPNAAMDASVAPFWQEEVRRLDEAIAFREHCGIVDIDLIKQRDRARSILKEVQDGRQTA